jgi:hypothetical protein
MNSMLKENFNQTEENKIKSLIKKELKDILTDMINKEVLKQVKKGELRDEIIDINKNVLIKLFRTLHYKNNNWISDIN